MQIDMVENGQELVRVYKEKHSRYDAIVTDIHMPNMHGTEAVKEIRKFEKKQKMKSIPVIFLTGNEDEKERKR